MKRQFFQWLEEGYSELILTDLATSEEEEYWFELNLDALTEIAREYGVRVRLSRS